MGRELAGRGGFLRRAKRAGVLAIAAHLHLGDDLGVVLGGQRIACGGEQAVLARDVGLVLRGETLGDLEQALAGVLAAITVELLGDARHGLLQSDLRRMFGGQRGELRGELGSACRQARKHRAFFVEKVPGHDAVEVRDRVADGIDVTAVGTTGGEPASRCEQAFHHVVVTAVRAVELNETGEIHNCPKDPPRRAVSPLSSAKKRW